MIRNCLFGLVVLIAFSPSLFGQTGLIGAFPSKLTVHEGDVFELIFFVYPGDSPVSVVDFFVNYDAEFLEILSFDNVESPLATNQFKPSVNPDIGLFSYGAFTLESPPTRSFPLVRLKIKALSASSMARLFFEPNGTLRTVLAFAGKDVLLEAKGAEIVILPKPETDNVDDKIKFLEVDIETIENGLSNIKYSVQKRMMLNLELKEKGGKDVLKIHSGVHYPHFQYAMNIDLLLSGRNPESYEVSFSSSEFNFFNAFPLLEE